MMFFCCIYPPHLNGQSLNRLDCLTLKWFVAQKKVGDHWTRIFEDNCVCLKVFNFISVSNSKIIEYSGTTDPAQS